MTPAAGRSPELQAVASTADGLADARRRAADSISAARGRLTDALRAARAAGATHAQLAEACGLSPVSVRNMLRDGRSYWRGQSHPRQPAPS